MGGGGVGVGLRGGWWVVVVVVGDSVNTEYVYCACVGRVLWKQRVFIIY